MPSAESRIAGELAMTREAGGEKWWLLAIVVVTVLALDITTKLWIVRNVPLYHSIPVLGEFFRITYTQNPGAAFGINVGAHSRVFFLVLSVMAIGVLVAIYRATPTSDRLRLFAVSLITGGALGNILDRIRYARGVVDFLDLRVGSFHWPVFNVADMAVSIGAVLLLVSFYFEERHDRESDTPDA